MRRDSLIGGILLGLALLFSGCERNPQGPEEGTKENPPITAAPDIVEIRAVNSGADLYLEWTAVENAEEYYVYCDNDKIATTYRTSYTIEGWDHVCMTVKVAAYGGGVEMYRTVDLRPSYYGTADNLATHDAPSGYSWVKIDFNLDSVSVVQQDDVDPSAPNVGWFVFYNRSGLPQFRDIGATSFGQAQMEIAFSIPGCNDDLAPDAGSYVVVRDVSSSACHFFWADNTRSGYGSIDENDYFGIVRVGTIVGSGPYYTSVSVSVQDKVPGLRWMPL